MSADIQIIQPPTPRNRFYHLAGLGLLAMNSWRHRIQGYKTPRPWFSQDGGTVLEYDRAVFSNWRRHLDDYLSRHPQHASGRRPDVSDQRVEVVPGPAGSMVIWDRRLPHSSTHNLTEPLGSTSSSMASTPTPNPLYLCG